MIRVKGVVILMVLLFSAIYGESNSVRIGVFTPDVYGSNNEEYISDKCVNIIKEYLSSRDGSVVLIHSDIEAGLKNLNKQMPQSCREPICVQSIGEALKLDQVIYGSLYESNNAYAVTLYLLDVRGNEIINEVSIEGEQIDEDPSGIITHAIERLCDINTPQKSGLTEYYGKKIKGGTLLSITSGAFLTVGIVWAALWNKSVDGEKKSIDGKLSGIGASADLIPLWGRPGGLGNAYMAASDDAYGVFYNPAGMAFIKKREAAIGYQYRFGIVNNIAAAYVDKAFRDFGYGHGIQVSNDFDGMFSEITFRSAYSYKFNKTTGITGPLSIGISLRIISKRIHNSVGIDAVKAGSAFGAGIDMGAQWKITKKIHGAIVLKNTPSIIRWNNGTYNWKYRELEPTELHLGGVFISNIKTFLIGEVQIPLYKEQYWKGALGLEHVLFRIARLRLGVEKIEGFDTPWKINGGFGIHAPIKQRVLVFDCSYEFNTLLPLSNVVNCSFKFEF